MESWNTGFAKVMPPRVLDRKQIARWERDIGTGPVQWWLADTGASVVGFAGTGPSRDPVDPDLGELDTIAVSPLAWRRGVGSRPMHAALGDLRGSGCRQAIVWTIAGYAQGRKFYESTGWHASGEVRDSGVQIAFRRPLLASHP